MKRLLKTLWDWWPFVFILGMIGFMVSAAFGEVNTRGGGGGGGSSFSSTNNDPALARMKWQIQFSAFKDSVVTPLATAPTNVASSSLSTFTSGVFFQPSTNSSDRRMVHYGTPFSTISNFSGVNFESANVYPQGSGRDSTFQESFIVSGDFELLVVPKGGRIRIRQGMNIVSETATPSSGTARYYRYYYSNSVPRVITAEFGMGNGGTPSWFAGIGISSNDTIAPYNLSYRKKVAVFHDSVGVPTGGSDTLFSPWRSLGEIMGWDVANFSIAGRGFVTSATTTNYIGTINVCTPFQPDAIFLVQSANDNGIAATTYSNAVVNTVSAFRASNNCPVGVIARLPTGVGSTNSIEDAVIENICSVNSIPFLPIPTFFQYAQTNQWLADDNHYNTNGLMTVPYVIQSYMLGSSGTNFMSKMGLF